jgi:hypothetical protein
MRKSGLKIKPVWEPVYGSNGMLIDQIYRGLACCYLDPKTGDQCKQPARFWVGKTEYDATHACGDHVEDLKQDGDTVFPLETAVEAA